MNTGKTPPAKDLQTTAVVEYQVRVDTVSKTFTSTATTTGELHRVAKGLLHAESEKAMTWCRDLGWAPNLTTPGRISAIHVEAMARAGAKTYQVTTTAQADGDPRPVAAATVAAADQELAAKINEDQWS